LVPNEPPAPGPENSPTPVPADKAGALAHLRVLDLTRILAGPWATQTLGDLGAEVIKIERPDTGDDTRSWGPPYLSGTELSAYFLCTNRNKRSVAIDIAQPEGAALLRRLALESDVLVENFKVGGLKQYGLDYEALKAVHPGLIFCSITGFGQTGPEANRPGYDAMIQAVGGLMSITGRAQGEPGDGPQKVGVAIADIMTGLYATIAILAALEHRARTGEGQYIDISLFDVQVACLANQALNFLATGEPPGRLGNAHPSIVPYQDFPTADGYLMIAVGNDAQFGRMCRALERPEWACDARFSSNQARVEHRDVLVAQISDVTGQHLTQWSLRRLEAAGVPCGAVNSIADVFAGAQARARGLAIEMRSDAQRVPLVASPLRLSRSAVSYRHIPPRLGADTYAVLQSLLRLTEHELGALARRGIVQGDSSQCADQHNPSRLS
jgi:crotonobetainyl-CoA:carnitine CoA-transferase CaiB-like acyl-CoA transferase